MPTVADIHARTVRVMSFTHFVLCLGVLGCATTRPAGMAVGNRFLLDTPPPPCLQAPRSDTSLVPVALVDPKPTMRGGRMVAHDPRLLAPGEIASVLLEFVVNADGSVDTASIRPLEFTNPALIPTALQSLRHLEFWPGCVRTEAVRTRVAQRFRYTQSESWYPRQAIAPITPSARP